MVTDSTIRIVGIYSTIELTEVVIPEELNGYRVVDELQQFKGSELEKRVFVFCKTNGIIYSKLTDEEKLWLTRIIQKSKKVQSAISQRGKNK